MECFSLEEIEESWFLTFRKRIRLLTYMRIISMKLNVTIDVS